MAFRRNFKAIIKVFLAILPLVLLVSLIFSISCQVPASTPSIEPTPAIEEEETALEEEEVKEEEQAPASVSIEAEISGFAFVPATINVAAGTRVTWANLDSATHTVTSETSVFDSGNLARNASFSYTFTDRGTFDYYCTIHPSMRGKVIVE